jgi:hypothetical protein
MNSPQLYTYYTGYEVCRPSEDLRIEEFMFGIWTSQLERDYFRDCRNNTTSDLPLIVIKGDDLQVVGRTVTNQERESIDGSSFSPTISVQIGPMVSV